METYNLPKRVAAVVFDIDGTLYSNDAFLEEQKVQQVERYAQHAGIDPEEASRRIAAARARRARAEGVETTSMGNALAELGVPIATSVAWREEMVRPEAHLSQDPRLRRALGVLREHLVMVALTNNPVSIAWRTLEALGVRDLFEVVIGLDSTWRSKPAHEPIAAAIGACTDALAAQRKPPAATQAIVSVGDRFQVDIEPALAAGCSAVLVEGVEEVYELPSLLLHVTS